MIVVSWSSYYQSRLDFPKLLDPLPRCGIGRIEQICQVLGLGVLHKMLWRKIVIRRSSMVNEKVEKSIGAYYTKPSLVFCRLVQRIPSPISVCHSSHPSLYTNFLANLRLDIPRTPATRGHKQSLRAQSHRFPASDRCAVPIPFGIRVISAFFF